MSKVGTPVPWSLAETLRLLFAGIWQFSAVLKPALTGKFINGHQNSVLRSQPALKRSNTLACLSWNGGATVVGSSWHRGHSRWRCFLSSESCLAGLQEKAAGLTKTNSQLKKVLSWTPRQCCRAVSASCGVSGLWMCSALSMQHQTPRGATLNSIENEKLMQSHF